MRNTCPLELRDAYPCDFRIVSSGEMAEGTEEFNTSLTLYLYRIINEHVRNAPAANRHDTPHFPLSIDLHFMLSVWARQCCS